MPLPCRELPLSINELRKLTSLDVRSCHLRILPFTLNDLRGTLKEVSSPTLLRRSRAKATVTVFILFASMQ